MSIQHLKDKIKSIYHIEKTIVFNIFVLIIVAVGAFFLGRISTSVYKDTKVQIVNSIPYF